MAGLSSPDYLEAPPSLAKCLGLLSHIWIPVFVVSTSGLARLIRTLRANLLDELYKPSIVTARARGVPEWRLLLKYQVRVALNPLLSTIGWFHVTAQPPTHHILIPEQYGRISTREPHPVSTPSRRTAAITPHGIGIRPQSTGARFLRTRFAVTTGTFTTGTTPGRNS